MKKAFTIIELLIVVVIIGVLATVAIPSFSKVQIKTKNKEAVTLLNLTINSAKMYKIETGAYVSCTYTVDCNDKLNTALPYSKSWNASFDSTSKVATVASETDTSWKWTMSVTDTKPTCSGGSSKCI